MENFPPPGSPYGAGPSGPSPSNIAAASASKSKPRGKRGKKGKGPTSGNEGDPKVTRRVVTRQRTVTIVMALVVAAVVAFALTRPPELTYVVRTTAAVGQFSVIVPSQLEAFAVDPDLVEAGAFTGDDGKKVLADAIEEIGDGRLQYPLSKGQQVHIEAFTNETTMPTSLAENERLISISAVASTSVAGNLRAGDRVDIIAVSESGSGSVASIVKTDVPLESVSLSGDQLASISASQADPESENYDKGVGELVPATPIPGTYVVRVTTDDMLKFALLDSDGTTEFHLIYRGGSAVDVPSQLPLFITEALGLNAAPQ